MASVVSHDQMMKDLVIENAAIWAAKRRKLIELATKEPDLSTAVLALRLRMSATTVSKWLKEEGIKLMTPSELSADCGRKKGRKK